jgi:integrase/recombinase XerD
VYVPIPRVVSRSLLAVPHKHPEYFFWSGHSKLPAAVSVWRKRLAQVFKDAGIQNGHSHRFRDTFSVELLQGGLGVESLSNLLGHQNIKVTQRHYSPWVKTRQTALDLEVRKALRHGRGGN